jgi:hypothetical protein
LTRHWAQVPPPPQAEGTKSFCSASVCSSLPPAGTAIVFSPLMVMLTLPVETSASARRDDDRDQRQNDQREEQYAESKCGHWAPPLQLDAAEGHEGQRHQASGDKGDAEALQAVGDVGIFQLLAHARHRRDRQAQPKPEETP